MLRAIESMYCFEYYSSRDPDIAALGKHIPERLCKHDSIQKGLAKSAGLIMFVRMCCAIIGTIPLGQLADRKGRKIALLLHKVNVVIGASLWLLIYKLYPRVPIWTLYFTGVTGLIGGNFDVGLAILFASYSDVMPSASERATLFFLTTSMQYVSQVVCPPIGGWLMNLDGKGGTSEVAMGVGVGLAALAATLVIFFFPETLDKSKRGRNEESAGTLDDSSSKPQNHGFSRFAKLWGKIKLSLAGVGVLNIVLLFVAMLCASIGIKSIDWYGLLQYPVIKLGWTFPQASVVLSVQAVVMLINYWILLPSYTRLGTKYLGSGKNASFAIMIGSSLVLAIGAVITGLSSTASVFLFGMIIYTAGEGVTVAINAYIASVIEKGFLARVMSVVAIAATGGKAIASGFFPQVLAIGLDTHVDELVGLPFLVAAGLFLVAGASVAVAGGVGIAGKDRSRDSSRRGSDSSNDSEIC